MGKGKFEGVLLATDFDDTYCPESGIIPPANLEAVAYFKAQGGYFTVSTGRSCRTFSPFLDVAPVNAPVVLSNGAQLYDFSAGKVLMDITLPEEAPADLTELLTRFPELSLETYLGEDACIFNPNAWTYHHINKVGLHPTFCSIPEMPLPWNKAVIQQETDLLLAAQAYIRDRWPDRYEAILSTPHILDVTAKGGTKGNGVLEVARLLGVERKNLYCVGDNQNDIPMLAVSAIPFAPGDCAQAVKDWGATLLPPCEEGAIARLIEILDRRY